MNLALRNKISVIASYTTFWGWNLTFLVLSITGIMPWLGLPIMTAVITGVLSFDFLITICLLILVPASSLWFTRKKFLGKPDLQIRFFYGVEVPIFFLCLLRLFVLRELTLASAFLIGSILFAAFLYSRHLIQSEKSNIPINRFILLYNSFLLIIALYVGVILSFYALPTGWSFIEFIFSFEWLRIIYEIVITPKFWFSFIFGMFWWLPFGLLFFYFSIALFIFSPIALVLFYGQAWLQSWKREAKTSSPIIATGSTVSIIAVWIIIFFLVDRQPQTHTFEVLAQPAVTQLQKENILKNEVEIRQGLLNAYLYPYRYLSARTDVNSIEILYENVIGLPHSVTKPLQNIHNTLLSPLLYKGDSSDIRKAADLYALIFDTPIQKGEKETVITALEASAYRDQVEAGLLNINQQKVWLEEQKITTTQQDSIVNVELYEVYYNQTLLRQEVFYYFSLPENATITGLWLGESSDKDKRQAYTVSPRGVAHKVYREQVRERVDPALLEQVGPRQYRLRAFPIPPMSILPQDNNFFSDDVLFQQSLQVPPKMHLWLTYSVFIDGSNIIFPELLEKRNVFWTDKTKRSINGSSFSQMTGWMPDNPKNLNYTSKDLKIPFKEEGVIVSAKVVSSELLKHANNFKIAILIDTSYSMLSKKEDIFDNIDWLQNQKPTKFFDFFICPVHEQLKKISDPPKDLSHTTFYGFVSDSDLWNQASKIQTIGSYDAVFVLTDQGSYELSQDKPTLLQGKSPVWFVHLGQLAPAYEDNVMYKLLTRGGVATRLEEAYHQFLMKSTITQTQRIYGNTLWDFTEKASIEEDNISKAVYNPIASKVLIDYLSSKDPTTALEVLDAIHQIAKRVSIVSPYSSMIVLVNDQQKEQLNKAEKEKDRFDRVVDKGIEDLSMPNNVMVSAVPEPEIWVLLIVTLAFLLMLHRRQKTLKLS